MTQRSQSHVSLLTRVVRFTFRGESILRLTQTGGTTEGTVIKSDKVNYGKVSFRVRSRRILQTVFHLSVDFIGTFSSNGAELNGVAVAMQGFGVSVSRRPH